MNTLIVYGTKYGCTEKCAKMLVEKLEGKVDLLNLRGSKVPELIQYDKIIIGGSVYIGKIRKEITKFCSKNLEILKNKKLGLYICCMAEGEIAQKQLNDSFPQELNSNAAVRECFGGEFIFKNMNFLDRLIVKKVSKIDKDTSNIKSEDIIKFAQLMNKA